MQALNFTLELFKKSGIPFKLNSEEQTERVLKVFRINITKEHVQKGHVLTYIKAVEFQEKKKKNGRNSLVFLFEGYEREYRRMFEIPEIKSWVQKMVKNKPHLFYFVMNMNDNYVQDLALCLVNPVTSFIPKELQAYTGPSNLILSDADVTPAIRKLTESTFLYAKKLKHTEEELMDICMTFLDNTGYEQHIQNNKRRPVE